MLKNSAQILQLKKYNYILCFIYWLLTLVLLFGIALVSAQEAETVRVLWADSYSDGNIIIQLAIPEGQNIESAKLSLSDGGIADLEIEPEILPVEYWLLLDAGRGAIDVAPIFQAAIEALTDGFSENQELNLIIFGDEAQVFETTSDRAEVNSLLDAYNPRIDEESCVADALAALVANRNYDPNRAQRVLLFVGEVTEQTECTQNTFIDIYMPIDVIQLANNSDDSLSSFARNSGGSYSHVNVQSLNSTINEIQQLWNYPVYMLRAEVGQLVDDAEIIITLSNGQIVNTIIDFQEVIILPTSTPTHVPTDIPTIAPSATDTPIPATEAPTIKVSEQVVILNTGVTVTLVPVTDIPVPPTNAENVSASTVNNTLLIMGGVAAILVVVVIVFVLLLGRYREQQAEKTSRAVESATEQDLGRTQMLDEELEAHLNRTETVSVEEVVESARSTLIGLLHHEESGISYEIHAPITILGRNEGLGIRFEGDLQISREHVRFSQWPDKTLWITRLTQNPVLVNEESVEKTIQLNSGDVLQLSTKLRLRYEEVIND